MTAQTTIQALGTTNDQAVIVTVEQNASGRVWLHIDDRSTGAAARLTPQMVRRLIASLEDTLVALDAPPEFDSRTLE